MAQPNGNNLNNPAEFQEDLAGLNMSGNHQDDSEAEARERQYQQQLIEQQNQQRRKSVLIERAKSMAKDKAKQFAGKAVKKVAGQALKAGTRSLALNPYVWIFAGLLALLAGMIMIVIMSFYIVCNEPEMLAGGGIKGKVIAGAARITTNILSPGLLALLEDNVCQYIRPDGATVAGADQPPTGTAPAAGQDLVRISGIPVEGASDPRLRPCMLARMQLIYKIAKSYNIDFVITSAYRVTYVAETGSLSAHSRGEAVDIAIRPKGNTADKEFMKKVRILVGIAQSEGFKPAQGDTLDEYSSPTAGATGGHIHIEYNTAPGNKSYCTNPTNYDDQTQ